MFKNFKRLLFIFKFKKFIPFLRDFFLSQEVKLYKKILIISVATIYVLLPFDLIPSFVFLFGIVDDFVVVTFLLGRIVKMAPQSLKDKYDIE